MKKDIEDKKRLIESTNTLASIARNRIPKIDYDGIVKLVRASLSDKLITKKQKELYLDVMLTSEQQSTLESIEYDILIKVNYFDFENFKSIAPKTLKYIKQFFPIWYYVIIEPIMDTLPQKDIITI